MLNFGNLKLKENLPVVKNAIAKVCSVTENFFKSRKSKDNKWNLKFFIYTIAVLLVTEIIVKLIYPKAAIFIMIPEIILAIVIAKNINPVEHPYDGYSLNTDLYKAKLGNRIFKKKDLNNVVLLIMFAVVTLLVLDLEKTFRNTLSNEANITFCAAWILMFPTLYCMIKNLPLTMFLHKDTWEFTYDISQESSTHTNTKIFSSSNSTLHQPSSSTRSSSYKTSESLMSSSNMRSNPINRNLPGNIFNHKR
ncbi:MAG UNVERIFIED_CONTAM: hypothetical protein LVQ98_08450 [Rickettsiaceae bacterium]|jgi:hypothetical protein